MYNTIVIGGKTYELRFPGLIQIDIERNAAKFFGLAGKKLGVADLMQQAGYVEVQAYLLWQGLKGGNKELRKMPFEDAVQLRDDFLVEGDLDTGERMEELQTVLALAISESMGIDGKKLKEKNEADQKRKHQEELEEIYLAKMKAEARFKREQDGTGTEPGETPSESSDSPQQSS